MAEKWQREIPATARKRGKAARRGQFPKSQELSIAAGLITIVIALAFLGRRMMAGIAGYGEEMLSDLERPFQNGGGARLFGGALEVVFDTTGPMLGVLLLGSLIVGVWQTKGISISGERLRFEANRLNPLSGLKKIFGVDGLVKLGVGLLKLGAIATVLWLTIQPRVPEILQLVHREISEIMAYAVSVLFLIIVRVIAALVAIAFLDKRYQAWRHEENLKMSKEEHKEEMKSVEGNPKIKKRILEMQRKILLQRMFQDAEQADVVVTNPTHFAVALKYDDGSMGAPRVVAKGKDLIAARIRELAEEHSVPLFSAPPLARALFRSTKIGQEVPAALYTAVAQVLAYVYQVRDARAGVNIQKPALVDIDEEQFR